MLANLREDGVLEYLQVDIDPAPHSLEVLRLVLDTGVSFATVTFEHDAYNCGVRERDLSRVLLEQNGYQLVVSDVEAMPTQHFEDWWIHPSYFPEEMQKLPQSRHRFSAEAERFLSGLTQ